MNSCEKQIYDAITGCDMCENIPGLYLGQKETGLHYGYPKTKVKILIIAESPPAPGKGFFYDMSTKNGRLRDEIFNLLTAAGFGSIKSLSDFDTAGFYLADSINCRWQKGDKALPSSVSTNCLPFLEAQIRCFKPEAIITFGSIAKKSLSKIQTGNLKILNLQFPFGYGKYMTEKRQDRIDKLKILKEQMI